MILATDPDFFVCTFDEQFLVLRCLTKSDFNLLGVVVIDDQPEVTIDDPAFLFENNDGFQKVTSKKTAKKQKVAIDELKKLEVPPPAKLAKKDTSSTNKVR